MEVSGKMEELNAALHKFNQNIVEVSRQVCRENIAFSMTQVILPILEKVGELDVRFKCVSPMPNEMYFPGMKTTSVNEFELTVILTNLVSVTTFEDAGVKDSSLSCYGQILPQQAVNSIGDVLLESGPSQGFLSSQKVRQTFAQLVRQAATVSPVLGISVEVSFKEPYTVVKIQRGGADPCLVELVPAFLFPGQWPVSATSWPPDHSLFLPALDVKALKEFGFYAEALPCPSQPGDHSLFRVSFSMAEKFLLRPCPVTTPTAAAASLDNGNCLPLAMRKDCERILRMIRESDKDDFHPVSSYHIKTVLLHECAHWPNPQAWAGDKLGERFLELLQALILVLDNRELPHFFIRDCNLLRHYSPDQLRATASRLRAIQQDIYMSPSDSIRLQC